MSLSKLYKSLLAKYPLGSQAVQAGILMAVGDQMAQNIVEKRRWSDLDWTRTGQFFLIGFIITGPSTRKWYGILDKAFGSTSRTAGLKKVACDQLIFAPIFIGVLLSSIGLMQGNGVKQTYTKISHEYKDILLNNYKLWPMVQFINFTFVPLNYQVLVVQSVAVLWNTYISYKTNNYDNQSS